MTLHCLGWGVVVSSMLAATFAPAAFAEEPPSGGDDFVGSNHNGLSSQAFRRNALTTNPDALHKLLDNPLDDQLFVRDQWYIGRQLGDRKAMAMMEELVECALDANTTVTARDREGTVLGQWRGEMGLCQRWHTRPLGDSEACQELVTACVMARVNAVGKSIALSLRSEVPRLFSLRNRVPVETRFRESPPNQDPSEGWPIPSFSTECQGAECHWSPGYVGTCFPGTEVQLAIDDPSDRSACGSTALRVCAGMYGCLGPTIHELPRGVPVPPYAKFLGEKSNACRTSPLRFTCPSDEATGGFYSVMTRPHGPRPRPEPSGPHVVKVKGLGQYPAPAKVVFGFPEGAFYGNMFDPRMLNWSCALNGAGALSCTRCDPDRRSCKTCDIDPESGEPAGDCSADFTPIPYRDVYACYTYAQEIDDNSSVAALNKRLCDTPDAKATCFSYPPQRCHYNAGTNGQEHSLCERIGKDGVFGYCTSQLDPSRGFRGIITTYIHEPCDFVDEGRLCDTIRRALRSAGSLPGGATKVPPGPRGCGGCSLSGPGGALSSLSLAAVVALVLRRRRRRHTD